MCKSDGMPFAEPSGWRLATLLIAAVGLKAAEDANYITDNWAGLSTSSRCCERVGVVAVFMN
jgi:hypothetical protein